MNNEVDDVIEYNMRYPDIKKILVPLDRTPLSIKAARYGIHLAHIENAELIVLLNVIEDVKQGGAIGLQAKYGNMNLVREFEEFKEETASNVMNQLIAEVQRKEEPKVNVKSEILHTKGKSVAKVVSDYAYNNNIDIIIMGGPKLAKWKYLNRRERIYRYY
jgi:nucleotide-binding universal stress UspA family protein